MPSVRGSGGTLVGDRSATTEKTEKGESGMAKKPLRLTGKARPRRATSARARIATTAMSSSTSVESVNSPIIGVGASAGGLEAFSQLLQHLSPLSQLSFVLVQHLSPRHESALPALLAARTHLQVVPVTDGMPIEPGHVYVIPPNVQITAEDRHLNVEPRPLTRSQYTPIDRFFQSLAKSEQNRALGIILSGTASDGAVGLREIKAAGGITIVQRPETAKYDGMPRAALATGMVDLSLSPSEIADHLSDIEQHPYVAPAEKWPNVEKSGPSDAQLDEILTLLHRASGVNFKQYKPTTVKRRLLRRMALARVADVIDYIQYLHEHQQEVLALHRDLLLQVTRFFRDPESFDTLLVHAFPHLANRSDADATIRIWVPGCASGEEAYSVAIAFTEFLDTRPSAGRVQIFATDVSETAIEHARAGLYPHSITDDVSPERLARFFVKTDGGYKIGRTLRDWCIFARHDLTRDPPFSRLDLVVCRNVLIYLELALQRRLISTFHYALKPAAMLMLGPAETTGYQHLFTVLDKKWRLYQKATIDVGLPVAVAPEHAISAAQPRTVGPRELPPPPAHIAPDEATRLILQRFAPAGVVVDENLRILQFRGQTGLFLEPASGEPSLNLLKMAREGLIYALRTATHEARRLGHPVRREGVRIRDHKGSHHVNVEVLPLEGSSARHLLVLFEQAGATAGKPAGKRKLGRDRQEFGRKNADERMSDLTRELAASREYLQSIIQELEAANEELQSANEEILSSNEELQSTNEELDTAKEELQSTNEELTTVNDELHSRNEELTRVNSDLVNLLASVQIPIVIVGEDLRIRRFTPMAERMLNVIPSDVGRPIGQINPNIVCPDLSELIVETIESVAPRGAGGSGSERPLVLIADPPVQEPRQPNRGRGGGAARPGIRATPRTPNRPHPPQPGAVDRGARRAGDDSRCGFTRAHGERGGIAPVSCHEPRSGWRGDRRS
jgi:two-component system CheB/CheR fusion protein